MVVSIVIVPTRKAVEVHKRALLFVFKSTSLYTEARTWRKQTSFRGHITLKTTAKELKSTTVG